MDTLRNQIIERKVIDLITEKAKIKETPFEPEVQDTVGIEHAIGGESGQSEIPEAKQGGPAESLREPEDHT